MGLFSQVLEALAKPLHYFNFLNYYGIGTYLQWLISQVYLHFPSFLEGLGFHLPILRF